MFKKLLTYGLLPLTVCAMLNVANAQQEGGPLGSIFCPPIGNIVFGGKTGTTEAQARADCSERGGKIVVRPIVVRPDAVSVRSDTLPLLVATPVVEETTPNPVMHPTDPIRPKAETSVKSPVVPAIKAEIPTKPPVVPAIKAETPVTKQPDVIPKTGASCVLPTPTPQNNFNKGGCCDGKMPHPNWLPVCPN